MQIELGKNHIALVIEPDLAESTFSIRFYSNIEPSDDGEDASAKNMLYTLACGMAALSSTDAELVVEAGVDYLNRRFNEMAQKVVTS